MSIIGIVRRVWPAALLVAGVIFLSGEARAQSARHPFGLGLQAGNPTAITGKYWLGGDRYAWQFAVGTLSRRSDLYDGLFVTSDVVYRFSGVQPAGGAVRFGFHGGIGVGWADTSCYDDPWWSDRPYCGYSSTMLVARVPFAANMYFRGAPFEVYVELAPTVGIEPTRFTTVHGALGFRFYF